MEVRTFPKFSDMHLHLRQGRMLEFVLPYSAAWCESAVVMPNTVPAVLTAEDTFRYKDEIIKALPRGSRFFPIMTIQITDSTTVAMIDEAHQAGVRATKSMPYGVTTNSENGIRDFEHLYPVYRRQAELGMIALFHGELADPSWICIDREVQFIERVFKPLLVAVPNLRAVLEHITAASTVDFVEKAKEDIAATITAHHPFLTFNDVIGHKMHPHAFCLPVAKYERDRAALERAMVSGNPRFFLGTDSAPHEVDKKECADCCGGIFTAPHTPSLLMAIFERNKALSLLDDFASFNGPTFYGLSPSIQTIKMIREPKEVPPVYVGLDGTRPAIHVKPFMAEQYLDWQLYTGGD